MTGELSLPEAGSVVTVGTFDGVHLGHRAVLAEVVGRARAGRRAAVVVTFEPHPLAVLGPGAPPLLAPGSERIEALAEQGVDRVVVLRFDSAMAARAPEEFVREVLLARCSLRELVIGPDHGFGRGRTADRRTLPELGRGLGFGVTAVPPVPDAAGLPISSTRIRAAVAEGNLQAAAGWLGRPYRVTGVVVPGAHRGRVLGVPTINLVAPSAKALPPDGVYAARVEWGGGLAGAMLNQGPRPTFGDGRRALEAHLFGFAGDLYGRTVRVEWVERLRDVRRFESVDALRTQLEQDRTQALAALAALRDTSTGGP